MSTQTAELGIDSFPTRQQAQSRLWRITVVCARTIHTAYGAVILAILYSSNRNSWDPGGVVASAVLAGLLACLIPRSLRQRTLRMTATLCLAVSTAFSAQVILMIALVLATGCGGWESPTIALQAFPWMYLGMDANRKDPLTAPVLGVGLSLWALAMGNLVHPHPLPFGFAALLGAGLGLLAQRQPRASSAD